MLVNDQDGNVHEATLTTDPTGSSYGQAVLVVDGQGIGHFDVAGLELI